jgi:hypothetical protein
MATAMGYCRIDIKNILKRRADRPHKNNCNGGGIQSSTPEFLSHKFDLNKRDFNSRIGKLMNLGRVDMIKLSITNILKKIT